jgi:hypothetical protein
MKWMLPESVVSQITAERTRMKDKQLRESLVAAETEFTRRGVLRTLIKGAGLVIAYDNFGPKLFAAAETRIPYLVHGALGEVIIPVDQDPGWATFEPGITNYSVDVFVRNVLLGGNFLAFLGFLNCLAAINEAPVQATYGPRFLEMVRDTRDQYYSDILTGQFENDGLGDVLGFAAGLSLISCKGVFFSNYPNHLAYPNSEYQVRQPYPVKTGWDIMGLKGPVGPEEEARLRARFGPNATVIPGVDQNSPYI